MIIYGTRSKELAQENVIDTCENCETKNSLDTLVVQRYAHVFWLPIFPLNKSVFSHCNHCKQALTQKEMQPLLKESAQNLKKQTKTPIWMYSGLIVVLLLFLLGIIIGNKNDEENAKLILKPHPEDIFEIKTKDNNYTLYKVYEVKGDSVFVQVNNYETNKMKGLRDLEEKGFSDEIIVFTKAELKQMLENDEIIDIERE